VSDFDKKLAEKTEQLEAKVVSGVRKVKRSLASRMGRGMAWTLIGIVVLLMVLAGGFWWYSTTDDFNRRVGNEVVKLLEDATGGRVELKRVKFDLRHLAVEADGLVIHGLEGPDEAPYLSVDRIDLRLGLLDLTSRVVGTSIASHVQLNYLGVEHPQFHLMVDKDGKTNQPVPKHPKKSETSLTDTLLDLKAG